MPTVYTSLCLLIVLSSSLAAMENKENSFDKNGQEDWTSYLLKMAEEGKTEKSLIDEDENKEKILLNLAKSVIDADLAAIKGFEKIYGFPTNETLIEIERLVRVSKYSIFLGEQAIDSQKSSLDNLAKTRVTYDLPDDFPSSKTQSVKPRTSQKKESGSEAEKKSKKDRSLISEDWLKKSRKNSAGTSATLTSSSQDKQRLKKTTSGNIFVDSIGSKNGNQNVYTDSSGANESSHWQNSSGDITQNEVAEIPSSSIIISKRNKKISLKKNESKVVFTLLPGINSSERKNHSISTKSKSPRHSHEDPNAFLQKRSKIKRTSESQKKEFFSKASGFSTDNSSENEKQIINIISLNSPEEKNKKIKKTTDTPTEVLAQSNTHKRFTKAPRRIFKKSKSKSNLPKLFLENEINSSNSATNNISTPVSSRQSSPRGLLKKNSYKKLWEESFGDNNLRPYNNLSKSHFKKTLKKNDSQSSLSALEKKESSSDIWADAPSDKSPLLKSKSSRINPSVTPNKNNNEKSETNPISSVSNEIMTSSESLVASVNDPVNPTSVTYPKEIFLGVYTPLSNTANLLEENKEKHFEIREPNEDNVLSRLAKKQGQNLLASLLASKEIWETSTHLPSKRWIGHKNEKEDFKLISYPVTEDKIENLVGEWKKSFFRSFYLKRHIPDSIVDAMNNINISLRKSVEKLKYKSKKVEINRIKNNMLDAINTMVFEWTLIVGQYPKKDSFANKSIPIKLVSDSFLNTLAKIVSLGLPLLQYDVKETSKIKIQFLEIIQSMETAFKDGLKELGIYHPDKPARLLTTIKEISDSLEVFQEQTKKNIDLLVPKTPSLKIFKELCITITQQQNDIKDLLQSDILQIKNIATLFDDATRDIDGIEKYPESEIYKISKRKIKSIQINDGLHHTLNEIVKIKYLLEDLRIEINKIKDLLTKANEKIIEINSLKVDQHSILLEISSITSMIPQLQIAEMDRIKNSLIELFRLGNLDDAIINEAVKVFSIVRGEEKQKDPIKDTTVQINLLKQLLFEDVEKGDFKNMETRLFQAALFHINWLEIRNNERKTLCTVALENNHKEIKIAIEKYYEKNKTKMEVEILERLTVLKTQLTKINEDLTLWPVALEDNHEEIKIFIENYNKKFKTKIEFEILKPLKDLKDKLIELRNDSTLSEGFKNLETENDDIVASTFYLQTQQSNFNREFIAMCHNPDFQRLVDPERKQKELEAERNDVQKKDPHKFELYRQWVLEQEEFPYLELLANLSNQKKKLDFELNNIRKEMPNNLKLYRQWLLEEIEFPYRRNLIDDNVFSWQVFENIATDFVNKNNGTLRYIEKFKGTLLYFVWQKEKKYQQAEANNVWWPENWKKMWKFINKQALLIDVGEIPQNPVKPLSDRVKKDFFKDITEGNVMKLNKLIESGVRFEELQNEEKQSPSEFAQHLNLDFLSFALRSRIHWSIFKLTDLEHYAKSEIKEAAREVVPIPTK